MGHLEEGEGLILEERYGGSERERNHTFGGLGFDICNPNTCLGGDTLTVNMMIDIKVKGRGSKKSGESLVFNQTRLGLPRPDICHFFSTNVLLGSIFLHMKARKLWQNKFRDKTA